MRMLGSSDNTGTVSCFRSRRSRVRTVPSSRAGSSKQTKLELEPVLGKRSRSGAILFHKFDRKIGFLERK